MEAIEYWIEVRDGKSYPVEYTKDEYPYKAVSEIPARLAKYPMTIADCHPYNQRMSLLKDPEREFHEKQNRFMFFCDPIDKDKPNYTEVRAFANKVNAVCGCTWPSCMKKSNCRNKNND